jgi:hypothetical protein
MRKRGPIHAKIPDRSPLFKTLDQFTQTGGIDTMNEKKSLTDILRGSSLENIKKTWGETQAADEMGPLPAGEYVARIIVGELTKSRRNETPSYHLAFKVIEGEYAGRRFWHDLWLTPAALPMTKRDLAKLGVTSIDQLEKPIPQGIRCKVKLALRRDDDGNENNRVVRFDVVGVDAPEVDPFAPKPNGDGGPQS